MALNIGDTVGDYQIVGILGAGGMGKVYKVRNVISDRVEALKVLLPDLATEGELADRFTREIKLLASLNHPNIAALHTALRQQNQLLMVMEFVEGRTLEDRLKQGPLPSGEAADACMQVLSALGYAHERGVVHRDIKPANMMEMPEGTVKLMDFGIAKASADRRLTMTGTTLGSLFYMSPEQVKGSATLDGRSDLYSVGVSLYEMVTGMRPFKGDSDYSIMVAHLEQQPVPPVQIDPTLPAALSEIILTAIQKNPEDRFQSAQAFRAALESIRPMLGSARPTRPAAAGLPSAPFATQPAPAPMVATQPQGAPRPAQPFVPPPPPGPGQQAPGYGAPAPAMAPQMPPPAAQKGGHRGLWIALGALLAIAVIGIAAFQLPRFLGTKASEAPPVTAQEPARPPSPQAEPASLAVDPAAQPPASTPQQATSEPAPAQVPVQTPAQSAASEPQQPSTQAGGAVKPPTPRVRPAASIPAAVQKTISEPAAQPQAPVYQPPQTAAQPPAAPSQPAVDPAAMAEVRDRLRTMTARANAASRTLKTLEAQQRASGLGLRGDISAAWDRVSGDMEEARAAAKDGDTDAAKKALDNAERDLDRLEKFLGR